MSARHRQVKRQLRLLEQDREQTEALLAGYDAVIDDLLGRGFTPVDMVGRALIVHRSLAETAIRQLDEDIAKLKERRK